MNKEEFGLNLYEAIKLNSTRLQCLKFGKEKEAESIWAQLEPMLIKLEPADVDRILAMTGEESFAVPFGNRPHVCECCHAQAAEIQYSSSRGGWTCLACHCAELQCCRAAAEAAQVPQ